MVAENECLECKIGVILLCPWLGNISEFLGKQGKREKGYFWPMKKNNEKSANWVIFAPELTYEIIESRFSGCLVQEGAKGRFPCAGPIVMTFFHFVFYLPLLHFLPPFAPIRACCLCALCLFVPAFAPFLACLCCLLFLSGDVPFLSSLPCSLSCLPVRHYLPSFLCAF